MNPEKFNMIAPGILPDQHEIMGTDREGRVLITGGTEGIGRAIADEFLRRHNAVVICARNQEKLEATEHDHRYGNSRLTAEKVDIGDRSRVKTFVQGAIEDLGGLDAVILNAATFDFKYKSTDLSEGEIRQEMFKVNEVGNVVVIRGTREELKKTNGSIVFITTRFGVPQAKETASAVDSKSASAQEDIGNYIKNKRRIHEYLSEFIKDKKNDGVFVFSVIPGTVDTPANRELIAVGTPEISASKLKEREEGRERDTALVGRVIAKMTASRKKFNPERQRYDIDIENGEVVEISNSVIEFEKKQINRRILVGDVPYVGPDEGPIHRSTTEPYFRANEIVKDLPLWHMKNWQQDRKITSATEPLIERVKRFYGEDIDNLTFGDLVRGIESIQRDFETKDSIINITQSELWKRSRGEASSHPRDAGNISR